MWKAILVVAAPAGFGLVGAFTALVAGLRGVDAVATAVLFAVAGAVAAVIAIDQVKKDRL
jgi:hypothetical protein